MITKYAILSRRWLLKLGAPLLLPFHVSDGAPVRIGRGLISDADISDISARWISWNLEKIGLCPINKLVGLGMGWMSPVFSLRLSQIRDAAATEVCWFHFSSNGLGIEEGSKGWAASMNIRGSVPEMENSTKIRPVRLNLKGNAVKGSHLLLLF